MPAQPSAGSTPTGSARGHATTVKRLEQATGNLAGIATARMDERLSWFRAMAADERSWVGLIAQAGIAAFVAWYREPDARHTISANVFGTAPRELTRAISLHHTVELVRTTIDVVEEHADELAAPSERAVLREAILRYSREIAFAAAEIYARAAETRGAWDARLGALLLDSLLRGDLDESLETRAAALGFSSEKGTAVIIGAVPQGDSQIAVDALDRSINALRLDAMTGVHGSRLVAVVAGCPDRAAVMTLANRIAHCFGQGPIVVASGGTTLASTASASVEVLAALRVTPAWPDAPRPVEAVDLLPERALAGDVAAREQLHLLVHEPLASADPVLIDTLSVFLERSASLEATARALFVHANTVRYRLRRVTELTGLSPTNPRDAWTLRVTLVLARLPETE